MSDQKEKVFAEGFMFKRKDTAPEFVIGSQSIKVDEAIAFLQLHQKNGWVNLDLKKSKGGKYYYELDTWEPQKQQDAGGGDATVTTVDVEEDDAMPF